MTATETEVRWIAIASTHDVPPGWVLKVQIGGRRIALANQDGNFYALDDSCSHAGGSLGDNRLKEGCLLECPWHNAVFDVRTGDVVRGPARKAQKKYDIEIRDGTVFVTA